MSIQKQWKRSEAVFIPTCDICGAELDEEYDFYDAVEAKKAAGWRSKKICGDWMDFCPDCGDRVDRRTAAEDFTDIRKKIVKNSLPSD